MISWQVTKRNIKDLRPHPKNPRKLSKHDADNLQKSLEKYGLIDKPIITKDGMIIGGHQRLAILKKMGYKEVECYVPDKDLDAKEIDELNIRLNRNLGEWDYDILANQWDANDLMEYGFTPEELTLDMSAIENEEPDDELLEPPKDPKTKLGDLYEMGEHRLVCGDSTNNGHVMKCVGNVEMQLCLTDPPYGLGSKKASGKNSYNLYKDTKQNLKELADEWLPIARSMCDCVVFSPGVTNAWLYPEADWIMCWFYGGGQLRSSWGFNCWQPFLCYGKDPSVASGNGGRPDAVDMNTPSNSDDLAHPCPKPLALWKWFIKRLSFNNEDTIYDPFLGSGTTLIAAEQLKRKCYGIELDPAYCDIIVQRWISYRKKLGLDYKLMRNAEICEDFNA